MKAKAVLAVRVPKVVPAVPAVLAVLAVRVVCRQFPIAWIMTNAQMVRSV